MREGACVPGSSRCGRSGRRGWARTTWCGSTLGEVSETALTREVAIEIGASGLPTTFVPGRNLVFFAFAGAPPTAAAPNLVAGIETDFSGYPDCRDDTVKAMQLALNLGMDRRFVIHTPLMWIDKAATSRSPTPSAGTRSSTCWSRRSPAISAIARAGTIGAGCGTCPACRLRADGYAKWKAAR